MGRREDLGWAWKGPVEARKKRYRKGSKHKGKLPRKVKKWFRLRARVLATYGAKCMKCGSVENIEVDHIKPKSKFPELQWVFENLQVLCRECNVAKWNYHSTDYRDDAAARELDLMMLREARDKL